MEKQVSKKVLEYLSKIGSRGGRRSRRRLEPEVAREMTRVREARRAFRKYHARCFWSYDPHYLVRAKDIPWVAEKLKKNGDRELWLLGMKLCR